MKTRANVFYCYNSLCDVMFSAEEGQLVFIVAPQEHNIKKKEERNWIFLA